MKNYQVVRSLSLDDVEEKVNELLLKGWRPVGGMFRETIGGAFNQTMWLRHAPPPGQFPDQ